MISEATLQQIQSKTISLASKVAQKVWENKFILLPAAILGYGLLKNKDSLKSQSQQPNSDFRKKDSRRTQDLNMTMPVAGESPRRRRVYGSNMLLQGKLSGSFYGKENMMFEDVSTSCCSDKESVPSKAFLNGRRSADNYYESDVESVSPKDEKRSARVAVTQKKSVNPDDLFFNIFQKLN